MLTCVLTYCQDILTTTYKGIVKVKGFKVKE